MSDAIAYTLKASVNQTLGALANILRKGEAHAAAVGVEEQVFLSARLYPDMLTLASQVRIACDVAARVSSRLAGAEIPSFPDEEKTFGEFIARCDVARAHVAGLDDAAIDANAGATIEIPQRNGALKLSGRDVLAHFILPNMHFHAAIAYALLRHQGVALGKMDFLTP